MKPKLRFQGFHDDWEEKKLGEVAESIIGMTYSPDDLVNEQEGIWVLRSSNVQNDRIIKQDDKYISMEIPNKKMIKENDILLCSRNGSRDLIGKCAYISDTFLATFGAFMTVIRSPYNKFIVQNLRTIQFKKYIHSHLGATINQITNKDLGLYTLFLPSLPEQEKIGTFLSQLDDRIEKQEQKIALLKERKKGWMQKLFNQEIRFKDENGNDYPDWEEKKLGEISKSKGGTSLEKYVNGNGKYKFISIGNYGAGGKYIDNGQRIDLNEKTKEKLLCRDNLVMILNDKTSSGDILGTCLLIDEDNKYIYNQRSQRIILTRNVCPKFMYQYINNYLRKEILKQAQGGTQIYVNYSSIEQIKSLFPSFLEQEKIANFLSAQDELIEKEEEKLNLLKEQKKGLLQQMFI